MSADMVTAKSDPISPSAVSVTRKRRSDSGYDYKDRPQRHRRGRTAAGNGAAPIDRRAQYTKAFEAQGGEVLDLALSADRKLLAVASSAGEVRIYRMTDRTRAATVDQSSRWPRSTSLALNADGKHLAAWR